MEEIKGCLEIYKLLEMSVEKSLLLLYYHNKKQIHLQETEAAQA